MYVTRHDISLDTATTADASGTTPVVNARVLSVHITLPGSANFATTAVVKIVTAVTGQTVWQETLSAATAGGTYHRAPRQAPHTSAGVVLTATEGNAREPFYVGCEALTVTATDAGTGKTATVRILTG